MQMYVKTPGVRSGSPALDLTIDLQGRQSELSARKTLWNLSTNDAIPMVNVNYNQVIKLTTQADSALPFLTVSTSSIDEYKNWIGTSNETAPDHPWEMPTKAWSGKSFQNRSELSTTELSDIEKAGWIYLFNDSRRVADYREALERLNGSFEANVYYIKKLVIHPGGRFIVEGNPSILLIDELEIFQGGTFETYTVCHASIGQLQKHDDASFRNN